MPRRAKPKSKKRDWRYYASFGLNGLVALSMVLGTVFIFTGGSTLLQRAAPTAEIEIPTLAPTVSSDATAVATLPPSTPAATSTPTPSP